MSLVDGVSPGTHEGRYAFHAWEDGGAVFDRSSGSTHVLDAYAASQLFPCLGAPESLILKIRFPCEMSAQDLRLALDDAKLKLEAMGLSGAL